MGVQVIATDWFGGSLVASCGRVATSSSLSWDIGSLRALKCSHDLVGVRGSLGGSVVAWTDMGLIWMLTITTVGRSTIVGVKIGILSSSIVLRLVVLMEVGIWVLSVVHQVSMGLSILIWGSSVWVIWATLWTSHIGILWLYFSLDFPSHEVDVVLLWRWGIPISNGLASAI